MLPALQQQLRRSSNATAGAPWMRCAGCCDGRRPPWIPNCSPGLVHACRYTGLLDASVAAHEEARRLDPTIQTSVLNTYSLRCDWEQIVRDAAETDPDLTALALYRLGRKAEALAAWPGMPETSHR